MNILILCICAWSGSCRLKSQYYGTSVIFNQCLHHQSLLNASCSFLSAWSFLEGFSDRYLRIFSNSAQRLMVCLPLVRHRVRYSFFLLSSSNLSRRSLMQATSHVTWRSKACPNSCNCAKLMCLVQGIHYLPRLNSNSPTITYAVLTVEVPCDLLVYLHILVRAPLQQNWWQTRTKEYHYFILQLTTEPINIAITAIYISYKVIA